MASKTLVILEDDLDGGEANETVKFALDGVEYEIDLSSKNAGKMRDSLATYVGAARRVGGRAARGRAPSRAGSSRTAEIREWARSQKLDVSERGRIPAAIVEQYEKAHSK